jgi:hypothetical protein
MSLALHPFSVVGSTPPNTHTHTHTPGMIVTHGALRYCGEDLGVLVSLDLAACSVMQQVGETLSPSVSGGQAGQAVS